MLRSGCVGSAENARPGGIECLDVARDIVARAIDDVVTAIPRPLAAVHVVVLRAKAEALVERVRGIRIRQAVGSFLKNVEPRSVKAGG